MTAAAPADLALTADASLRLEGCDELATRIARAWTLRPAAPGSRPVCVLRMADDAHTPASPTSRLVRRHGGDGFWIDLDDFRPGCTLVCLPDVAPATLLPWLNVLLLDVGVIPLHASAFAWDGLAVGVTGAAHSGKTGALLAAVDRGATPLGDECVWCTSDGGLHGITLPVEVRLDYARELPRLGARLPAGAVRRARAYEAAAGAVGRAMPELSRKFARRARVVADPHSLVGDYVTGRRMDRLFVSVRHPDPDVVVRDVPDSEARALVCDIQMAEHRPVATRYRQMTAPSGGPRSELLDRLDDLVSDRIDALVSTVEVRLLAHPHPIEARRLVEAIGRER